LTQAQLPNVTLSLVSNGATGQLYLTLGAGTSTGFANGTGATIANQTNVLGGTTSALGSGNSHPIMPPAMALPYILRVV
jgi:hypothetical protein